MKRIFFLLAAVCFFACAAPVAAAELASREANFRLQAESGWSMESKAANRGGLPAWQVTFSKPGVAATLALLTVDGRKSPDIRQTAADFASGHAEALLHQMRDEQTANPPPGFRLAEAVVKKAGGTDYLSFRFTESGGKAVIYLLLTAKKDYLYSFNCKFTDSGGDVLPALEVMLKTLRPY
jgi:hypothetical protein